MLKQQGYSKQDVPQENSMCHLRKVKAFFLFFLIIPLAEGDLQNPWPFPTPEKEQAVVQVESSDAHTNKQHTATGFIIEHSGSHYAVTTAHHVKEANLKTHRIHVRNKKGRLLKIEDVVGVSLLNNLVLIKLENYEGPILTLADFENNRSFYIMGFSNAQLKQVKAWESSPEGGGRIAGMTEGFASLTSLSGGPAFNDKGEVIGVIFKNSPYVVEFIESQLVKKLLETQREAKQNGLAWLKEETSTLATLANEGNPEAQYAIAEEMDNLYHETGDIALIETAWQGYKEAAKNGNFMAQLTVGITYRDGMKVMNWKNQWRRLTSLGSIHRFGIEDIVIPDMNESRKWLRRALQQRGDNFLADFTWAETLTLFPETGADVIEGLQRLQGLIDRGFKPAEEHIQYMKHCASSFTSNTSNTSNTPSIPNNLLTIN